VLVLALGQLLIWGAPGALLACLGAALSGGGYALAFQGFGLEAVRRAPPQSRGSAMSGYVVFQVSRWDWLARWAGGWRCAQAWTQSTWRGRSALLRRHCWR